VILWLQFIVCTALIVVSGSRLSKYGDIIAEKTGLGKTRIGVVLLAATTSLPELITGLSAVTLFDVPDIAVGNVLGACMINLLMIAVLDMLSGPAPVSARAHSGQTLTAGLGIVLLGAVAFGLFTAEYIPSIGWVGSYSPVFLGVYLVGMRVVFLYEKKRITEFVAEVVEELHYRNIPKYRALILYGVNALVLIAVATYLPGLGERIAEQTGLGESFVGTIFIALSTTLPELVVSVAALRVGAVDMAFGNIFGSNLFNVAVLALDDFFYVKAPLLSVVAPHHVTAAIAASMMTAIAVTGLTYRTTKKRFPVAWDSLAIIAVYVLSLWILYRQV
jgi:cation:H+ antiporter